MLFILLIVRLEKEINILKLQCIEQIRMLDCTKAGQEAAHDAVMRLLDLRSCGRDGHLKQCVYVCCLPRRSYRNTARISLKINE